MAMPPDEMPAVKPVTTRRTGKARALCHETHAVCCAVCGLTHEVALDVAHLDQNPGNDAPDNLAWLCKTHHRLVDVGFYPVEVIKLLRDRWTQWDRKEWNPDHGLYIKDGAVKAGRTRSRSAAARKAVATRMRRKLEAETV